MGWVACLCLSQAGIETNLLVGDMAEMGIRDVTFLPMRNDMGSAPNDKCSTAALGCGRAWGAKREFWPSGAFVWLFGAKSV